MGHSPASVLKPLLHSTGMSLSRMIREHFRLVVRQVQLSGVLEF